MMSFTPPMEHDFGRFEPISEVDDTDPLPAEFQPPMNFYPPPVPPPPPVECQPPPYPEITNEYPAFHAQAPNEDCSFESPRHALHFPQQHGFFHPSTFVSPEGPYRPLEDHPTHAFINFQQEDYPTDFSQAPSFPISETLAPPPPPAPLPIRPDPCYAIPPSQPVPPPVDFFDAFTEEDVLCGRGALMTWHPGNKFYRQLVKAHREAYMLARRRDKPRIANFVLDAIRARGGRFLRESIASDGERQYVVWVEISEDKSYEKTCQALREGAPEIRRQWRLAQENKMRRKNEDTPSK